MKNSGLSYNSTGTVSGVFFTKKDADAAYNSLLRRGHSEDDISVLMSDETLNKDQNPKPNDSGESLKESGDLIQDSLLSKTTYAISETIISFTSLISLPGLGIAISNTLLRRLSKITETSGSKTGTAGETIGAKISNEQTHSFGSSMKEGGIIISVDPRNGEEKRAIVKDFKANNGHDILGDDGYTELD